MTGAEREDDLADDTIRVPRGQADEGDPTSRVPRAAASAQPIGPGADQRESLGSPAEHGEPAEPADDLDHLDDATAISRGRVGDETQPAQDSDGGPGPRRRAGEDAAAEGVDADEPEDGSTVVARRESRRRAAREELAAAPAPAVDSAGDSPAATGRIAQVPGETPPIYKPRAPEPVISTRSAPPSRPPQPPVDTRAEILYRRRRARQLALVAVMAGCFLVTVLVAGLLALTTLIGR